MVWILDATVQFAQAYEDCQPSARLSVSECNSTAVKEFVRKQVFCFSLYSYDINECYKWVYDAYCTRDVPKRILTCTKVYYWQIETKSN